MIMEVAFASEIYEQTLTFRDLHLRKPLGLKLSPIDVDGEHLQWHFVAMEGDTVVGTVILKPSSDGVTKLRQMAVDPSTRRTGLGRELVQYAETVARSRGFTTVEMMARVEAQGFYRKLGYSPIGAPFVEITIPHVKMTKEL